MAPELSRRARALTLALMVIASAATEVAAGDRRPIATGLAVAILWALPAVLLAALLPAPVPGRRTPPRVVMAALLIFAALPFVVDGVSRPLGGEGYALEIRMVLALRNLGLGLAAYSAWRVCLRAAGGVSLFLMLFAVSLADTSGVVVLLGVYGAAGGAWLMVVYWAGLRQPVAAHPTAVARLGRRRLGVPWVPVVGVLGAVGCAVALFVLGPRAAGRVLGEWMPTSGGSGEYDPAARGGINDGDEEVSGDNPHSTGMVESDRTLDSPLPSLYDMFNDRYEEPFRAKKPERSIALAYRKPSPTDPRKPADNLRPSRDREPGRREPGVPRDPTSRAARALIEVKGRTPLHLRATAFDTFDGSSWREAALDPSARLLDPEPDGYWMRVRERNPPDMFGSTEEHQLKVAGDVGSLVPAPPHLSRFRVGLVNDVTFFAWGRERVLRLAQRNTPPGVLIRTECRVVDPARLGGVRFPGGGAAGCENLVSLPPGLDPEVRRKALKWVGGRPRGWAQVEAVIRHLRTEYVHDRTAPAPEGCPDPLKHFLLESRRGPDYQFATAAAVLLRLLNYRTRLVSGFYAAPEHYDRETDHTPVGPDDVHFWAEVMLPSGDWLVLEPTPGYDVLAPRPGLAGLAWNALAAVGSWAGRHPVGLGVACAALAVLWWRRRSLLDWAALALWLTFPGRCWRGCLGRARRLLERRGRWAGRPRAAWQTFAAWLPAAVPAGDPVADDLARLARAAEWAAYAPDAQPPWPPEDVRALCRRVLTAWTLGRWRAALRRAPLTPIGPIGPMGPIGPIESNFK